MNQQKYSSNKKWTFDEAFLHNRSLIENPAYVKYTKGTYRTAVDPSILWEKICGGDPLPKLSDRKPKGEETYYEYGFDKEGRFVYRKCVAKKYPYMDGIDICYIYNKNKICEIPRFKHTAPYCEYRFDDDGKILEILHREKYEWIEDNIAIVTDNSRAKWLMFQKNNILMAVFSILDLKNKDVAESYLTGNIVQFEGCSVTNKRKIENASVDSFYGTVLDMKDKPTEFYRIEVLNKVFFGTYVYVKPPKSFSYNKVKVVYKNEVLEFIENKMNHLTFPVKTVGIQYFTNGFSILDINLGFDDEKNDDVLSMKESVELVFSEENYESMNFFNDYINGKRYYNAHRKLMKEIAKEIKEKHSVEIVLDEIDD